MAKCSIEGCDRDSYNLKPMCELHDRRLRKHGRVHLILTPHSDIHAFIDQAITYDGQDCLFWPFARDRDGYGKVKYNGKQGGAHRAICTLVHGEPPSRSHHAAHSCGNGHLACVNPKHLRWATPKENVEDSFSMGTRCLGARHPSAKLTPAEVIEIRNLARRNVKQREIAKMFGLSKGYVCKVVNGKTWASLTDPAARIAEIEKGATDARD